MRLYVLDCGRVRMSHRGLLLCAPDQPTTIPIPAYLIIHPRGPVLVDTGCHPGVVDDPVKHWGEVARVVVPQVTADQLVENQLRLAGVEPVTVRHVINTHLHVDHAGGNNLFPEATFYVQQRERDVAIGPREGQAGTYVADDWSKVTRWELLGGDADLFGEGTIKLLHLPGHTPGFQGVLVTLPEQKILLAGDAIYVRENLESFAVPEGVWDYNSWVGSARRVAEIVAAEGAQVLEGHDSRTWSNLRLAPQFYC